MVGVTYIVWSWDLSPVSLMWWWLDREIVAWLVNPVILRLLEYRQIQVEGNHLGPQGIIPSVNYFRICTHVGNLDQVYLKGVPEFLAFRKNP